MSEAAQQRDAADEGRLEPCGSIVVGAVIVNEGEVVRPAQLIASVRRTRGVRRGSAGWKRWALPACAGAVGGAINAWLCFAGIPVPMRGEADLEWPLVPAGALHGGALALVPVAAALAVRNRGTILRVLMVAPVGWIAGYVSWIPIHHWGGQESWRHSLLWLSRLESGATAGWAPFVYFGLVSAVLYLSLVSGRFKPQLAARLASAITAGVLGSLWFWSDSRQWYFSPLHGAIWGVLVGVSIRRWGEPDSAKDDVAEQGDEADER